MKLLKSYWQILLVGLLVISNLFVWYFVTRESRHDLLTLSYLDVGTGSAIYIEGPNGVQVLIDTGRYKQVLTALGKVMPFYDRSIDVVITSKDDELHTGGLAYVQDRYETLLQIKPGANKPFDLAQGRQIDLGNEASLTIKKLNPFSAELRYGATVISIGNAYPFEIGGKFYNPNLTGTVTLKIAKPDPTSSTLGGLPEARVEANQTAQTANVVVSFDSSDVDDEVNEKVVELLSKIASTSLPKRTQTTGCVVNGPYPDPECSPGAVFEKATLKEICVSGYSKTVRNVSVSLKKKVYAQYSIPYPQKTGTYECDHIIPLAIGGNNDIANLYPESEEPRPGFREKDMVENYLHEEVCAGRLDLGAAQKQIASDWLAVYNLLSPSEIKFLRNQWAKN